MTEEKKDKIDGIINVAGERLMKNGRSGRHSKER
jgi:hypothetical protein